MMKRARRRAVLLIVATLSTAMLAVPVELPLPVWVVFNPSASVARGWYRVDARRDPSALHVGDLVLARLPAEAAALAAQRGYLPEGVPVIKRVGAVAPQAVCVSEGWVRVDGVPVAALLGEDGARRPLHHWTQCRRLDVGELFLLSTTHPASFDSRYFGPVGVADLLGVAQPLWTW
ncbi:conjugative transfer signal peptidase TraF [Pseudacidovorax sp. 1753]|uniref:S26 family signal peptidase n=1 Tax=Pseudacidovorax sp. 1753 TaxID=3156419 RepID=UPI00339818BD